MCKNLLAALVIGFFTAVVSPAYGQTRTAKIILAGDSWSALPCLFKSAERAFKNKKLPLKILSCRKTSQVGAHANWWIKKKNFKKVVRLLQQDSRI
jgi:hypothetical protein